MAYSMHKRNRDRHRLVMRYLRWRGIFLSDSSFKEEYALYQRLLDNSRFSLRKGARFVRNRFHRFWRSQAHKMERAILREDEIAFEKENPHAFKGAIWWLID